VTPAEELRAAAAKLRETAKKATRGPWTSYSGRVDSHAGTIGIALNGYTDSEWIALMHPGRAEQLAALLEEIARQHELPPCNHPDGLCNGCERRDDFVYSVNVARDILGTDT
jgi:hypothetical protein